MSKFKLVEGNFTVAEARELILGLLEYKIQFHSKESFSSEIRTGGTDKKTLDRKKELLQTRDEFTKQLQGMDNDTVVAISANIVIE